ncbi:hypothetical protein [Clostridium tarantellae]|uniref:Uncharacterized protein n=1 Tax=Clostridium tarantellae TaxID=39493 RepID=A0A6I1MIH4_9CLOT|nr:hypothetical protein [Clostridium tarantellae]MPQ42704.1 hypothetical protein [Clostridium tarantellae]
MSEVKEVKNIEVLESYDEKCNSNLPINQLKKDLDKLYEYKSVLKKTFQQLNQNIFNSYKKNKVIKNGTLAITLNNAIKNAIPKNTDEYIELANEYSHLWNDIFKLIGENKIFENSLEKLKKHKEYTCKMLDILLDNTDIFDIKEFVIENNLTNEFFEDINKIEKIHYVLKEQTNQLYIYGAWCDEVTRCHKELINLIMETKIHREHISPYIFKGEIDEHEIKECVKDTIEVIKSKPNKLLTIFKACNKWENKVFIALSKCEVLKKNLEIEIGFSNDIIKENREVLRKANEKLSEFIISSIDSLDYKIKNNEEQINKNRDKFEELEGRYIILKEKILNIFESEVEEKEKSLRVLA